MRGIWATLATAVRAKPARICPGEQRYGDVYAALNLRDALEGMLGPLHQAYHVLGLHRMTSSEAELKAAYRRCLLEHHPDRVEFSGRGSKEEAEERTREIVEAFELISSAEAVPGRRQQAAPIFSAPCPDRAPRGHWPLGPRRRRSR